MTLASIYLRRSLDGIDGSHYQPDAGPMDLAVVAAIPTTWIGWKATQSTAYKDPTFPGVRQAAALLGFRWRLFYHWLSSTTDPAAQAAHYLAVIGTFATGEGAMLDAEEAGITVDTCLIWLETVEAVTLRPSDVYTGLYVAGGTIWSDPRIRMSKFGPRTMHVAAYVLIDNLIARLTQLGLLDLPIHAWQYSSDGPVAGITGRCDMNAILDPISFDVVTGMQYIPVTPAPNPQPEVDMKYATNSEDRVSPEDGQSYPPGKFVYAPQNDSTLRHVVGFEGRLYDGEPSVAFSNAELDEWMARTPVGTVELAEAVHAALAVALTGTGSISLSLFGKATPGA